MIRVLLVDDDYLARAYLRQIINWEDEGFSLIGDASNGEQALRQMETVEADIILTDLSMPVMDGIELIRKVREKQYAARIAVLSCHDEFYFVKEAMRVGADEYILKNSLDTDSLRALLTLLKKDLVQFQEQQAAHERLIKMAQQGSRASRKNMIQQLREAPLSFSKQQALLAKNDIKNVFYQCVAILVGWLDPKCSSLIQYTCERFAQENNAYAIESDAQTMLLLLDLTGISSASDQNKVVYDFTERLRRAFTDIPPHTPKYSQSSICVGDGSLTRAIKQAEQLTAYWFYGHSLVRFNGFNTPQDALPPLCADTLALLDDPLCTPEAFGELYRQALEELSAQIVQPSLVLNWILQLDTKLGNAHTPPPDTLDDCRGRLDIYHQFLTDQIRKNEIQVVNPSVAQAVQYIRAHYADPISLAEVAAEVGLNPTYLSFVFKRDAGINFSDYLLACRMKAVKHLLHSTVRPIKDVACEAGFSDYRHFCKLFKKETGLRPADFRRQT